MPDSNWPPRQRLAGRAALGAAYGLGGAAGLSALREPRHVVEDALGTSLGYGLASLALVGGAIAVIAVVAHKWHAEFVAVWFVAAAYGGYAVLEYERASPAAALALGALASILAWRGISLWVFSLEANRIKRARRRAGGER